MQRRNSTSPTLLRRLQDPRDREAWAQFNLLYRELLLGYCRARGLQLADAEDVTQTVQTSLLGGLRSFSYDPEHGRFRNYLRRTAQNAVYKFLAQSSRNREHLAHSSLQDEAGDNAEDDELWEREWMHHHLRRAMRTIRRSSSPSQLELFEALLSGTRVEDLAASTGSSIEAIYKTKQRMRSRLRELIALQIRSEDSGE